MRKSLELSILEPGRFEDGERYSLPDCVRIWLVTVPSPLLVTFVLRLTVEDDELDELDDWRTCEEFPPTGWATLLLLEEEVLVDELPDCLTCDDAPVCLVEVPDVERC